MRCVPVPLHTSIYCHLYFYNEQECIPVGCVPSAAGRLGGRVSVGGCPPGGVCPGGCLPGGVCLGGAHLPPVDRMSDACENITFPQLLLRTVMNSSCTANHWCVQVYSCKCLHS